MEISKLNIKKLLHRIIYLFAILTLISCGGWSVMGYALDESQDHTVEVSE